MNNFKIKADKNEVLRLLGYQDSLPDPLADSQIDACIKKVEEQLDPKYVYRVFDIEKISSADAVGGEGFFRYRLAGTHFSFEGNSADTLLGECHQCILLAVTLGRKADYLLMQAQVRNMAGAVITGCCENAAVEDYCNQINDYLESQYLKEGLYLTDRFSPGYGDMPIEYQTELCEILDTYKLIGLTTTVSEILTPTKSITAVIGISDKPQPKRITGCDNCKMRDRCQLRRNGTFCG
ncbi:MAG: methionine synthase [Firmicutes bacterium]|nr:methionine synthase [Bacillota bacterium]